MEDKIRNEVSEDMAKAAAEWWAAKIDGSGHHDNGARDLSNVLAGMLADTMIEMPNNEAITKFKDILSDKLLYCERYEHFHLGCDYGPCKLLANSAKEAGVSCHNFPWKTDMRIDTDKNQVLVSDGYRAPWEKIWPNNKKEITA